MCCGAFANLKCGNCGRSILEGNGEVVMNNEGIFHQECPKDDDEPEQEQACCG